MKYPIGIQTFSEIRTKGYTYVDKTQFVGRLVNRGKFYFLSRPRRFGKSLLLSTLHAYFEGKRDLFRGLALDSMDMDWTPSTVLHFDFNAGLYFLKSGLEERLDQSLGMYEKEYGIIPSAKTNYPNRLETLIRVISEKTGRQVVMLVDEYDKPLLGIGNDPELFERNQNILKGFFGVLKSLERHIRFAMLTGVARFSKVSIFSDLNNLRDISIDTAFADICGWTQEELDRTFQSGIKTLAEANSMSIQDTEQKMKRYYDGYLFAPGGNRLYNPYSVLNLLESRSFEYFWFETGTPTFLVNRIRKEGMLLPSLNNCRCYRSQLLAAGLTESNPIPLLFQTGYLTIRETYGDIFTLEFPNKEVEMSFARHLQPLYLPQMDNLNGPFSVMEFQHELATGQIYGAPAGDG